MPWSSAAPNVGFSTSEPWLPIGQNHRALAVEFQEKSPNSNLQFARACLKMRSTHRALRHGSMRIIEAGEQKLVFDRTYGGDRLRCTFNLSDRPAPVASSRKPLITVGEVGAALGPYAAIIEAGE